MILLKIGHAGDGSQQLRVSVQRADGQQTPERALNSGETDDFPLGEGDVALAKFVGYPVPPGNFPHGLKPSTSTRLHVQRIFGALGYRAGAAAIDDGKIHHVDGKFGEPTELRLA